MKIRAQDAVRANKIWGGIVGIIPGLDWVLQRFVIKKNAAEKIGQIFGIKADAIKDKEKNKEIKDNNDKDNKKNKEKKNKDNKGNKDNKDNDNKDKKNEKPDDFNFINKAIDIEKIKILEVDKVIKDSKEQKIANSSQVVAHSGCYIVGGVSIGNEIASGAQVALEIGGNLVQVIGSSFIVVGAAINIFLRGYLTHKFCENLIELCAEYYRDNALNISNSYEQAVDYFKNGGDKNKR